MDNLHEFIIVFITLNIIYGSIGAVTSLLKVPTKYKNRFIVCVYEYTMLTVGYYILNKMLPSVSDAIDVIIIGLFLASIRSIHSLEENFSRQGKALCTIVDLVFCFIIVFI